MSISWNDIKEKYNLNWPVSWADVKEAIGDEEWPVSWPEVAAAMEGPIDNRPIITFTINNYVYSNPNFGTHTYTAREGMTWGEWINSEYNNFRENSGGYLYLGVCHLWDGRDVVSYYRCSDNMNEAYLACLGFPQCSVDDVIIKDTLYYANEE